MVWYKVKTIVYGDHGGIIFVDYEVYKTGDTFTILIDGEDAVSVESEKDLEKWFRDKKGATSFNLELLYK